jgi:hypothetical protein
MKKEYPPFFNPEEVKEFYSIKFLPHVYFSTHFFVLDVVPATPADKKILAS